MYRKNVPQTATPCQRPAPSPAATPLRQLVPVRPFGPAGLEPARPEACPFFQRHGFAVSCITRNRESMCSGFEGTTEDGTYAQCGYASSQEQPIAPTPKRPPAPPPGLSEAEVQRLLLAYIGERTEVPEDELVAVLRWGHLLRQGAQLLEHALAATVRLAVHDGAVIAAWPITEETRR